MLPNNAAELTSYTVYRWECAIRASVVMGFVGAGGLGQQIDLAPTLLGILGFDYTSTFFGRNVLRADAAPGRALIGNYQHLGLFDGENLAILGPRRAMRRHDDALGLSHETQATSDDPLLRRDIAYYQGASHAFKKGLIVV